MIKAENGTALIKGDERDILTEYSAITSRILQDVLAPLDPDIPFGKNLTPESRAAAAFMANIETAVDRTDFDKADFYDVMYRVLKFVRARYES